MRRVSQILFLCLSVFAVSSFSTGAVFAHNHESKGAKKEAHCEKCHDKDGKKGECKECAEKHGKGECKDCPECKGGKKCEECSKCKEKHAKASCEGCKHDAQKDHKHDDGHEHKHTHETAKAAAH